MPITKDNVEEICTYHPVKPDQIAKYEAINEATKHLMKVILDNTPVCADQQSALRLCKQAKMEANSAIALGGMN